MLGLGALFFDSSLETDGYLSLGEVSHALRKPKSEMIYAAPH
jgi:hypothetical protein